MKPVTLADIQAAQSVLSKILPPTPLVRNEWLSRHYGCEVYLKLETFQPVGSFKIRGATYSISKLGDAGRKIGVIAASAGNHAQGVAWGARHFDTSALIVMPESASLMKISNTQALGATVHLEGDSYDQSFQAAQRIMRETGRTYVHAFHDPDVIAGQGTVGLELLQQLPEVDAVITSIGGGGLCSGMGIALKALKPSTRIIACQAENVSAMAKSLTGGKLVESPNLGTLADGIAVQRANPDMYSILSSVVDEVYTSDEEEIAMNVLRLMEKAKILSEGSAAITLGALDRYQEELAGKRVVLMICGGNIDVNLISRIIDRGLIRSGRRLHLRVQILDRPGSLSKLTALIAGTKANILQAIHDRSEMKIRLDETGVELMLETRGPEHSTEVVALLQKECRRVEVVY
jgi:threonine dehydratase